MIGFSSIRSLLFSAALLMAGVVQGQATQPRENPAVGEEICTYGYIMDYFCIERGTLLDAPSVKTLENPGKHSVHCLVDVGVCYNTPFHVLEDNPPDLDTPYGSGWAVDSNDLLMKNAREVGKCSTCTGGGDLNKGYRAQVIGTVVSVDPPILAPISVAAVGEGETGCKDSAGPSDNTTTSNTATTPASTSEAFLSLPTFFSSLGLIALGAFFTAI